jgi:hypothetical protein
MGTPLPPRFANYLESTIFANLVRKYRFLKNLELNSLESCTCDFGFWLDGLDATTAPLLVPCAGFRCHVAARLILAFVMCRAAHFCCGHPTSAISEAAMC